MSISDVAIVCTFIALTINVFFFFIDWMMIGLNGACYYAKNEKKKKKIDHGHTKILIKNVALLNVSKVSL